MKHRLPTKINRLRCRVLPLVLFCFSAVSATMVHGQSEAVDPAATKILKKTTEYISGLKQFSVDTQNTLEELLETGSRVDFDVSARSTIRRPNKIRSERLGDLHDQRFYYDGETLTLFNPGEKVYATAPAPKSIEGALDFVRDKLDLIVPVSDLVYSNSFELLVQDVTVAVVVGKAVINGTKCDHLLFRRPGVDFQLWVAEKGNPLPMKYVVTDTSTPERLSLVTVMSNWNLKPRLKDADFAFEPPEDAVGIAFLPLLESESANR